MELAQQWLDMQRSTNPDERKTQKAGGSNNRSSSRGGAGLPLGYEDHNNMVLPHNMNNNNNNNSNIHSDSTSFSHQQQQQTDREETEFLYRNILDAPLPPCLSHEPPSSGLTKKMFQYEQQPVPARPHNSNNAGGSRAGSTKHRGHSSRGRGDSRDRSVASRDPSLMQTRLREASTIGGPQHHYHTYGDDTNNSGGGDDVGDYLATMAERDAAALPVHDQLLAKGKLTEQKKEELVLEEQERQHRTMKSPTISRFAKELSESKRGGKSVPFFERSAQMEKKKQERRKEQEEQRAADEKKKAQKMFQPKLSAQGRRAQSKVHNFTENAAAWQERKIQHAVEERTKQLVDDLKTLQDRPMISRRSEQLAQRARERTLHNTMMSSHHSDPTAVHLGSNFTGGGGGNNNANPPSGGSGNVDYIEYMMERDRQSKLNAWEATVRHEMEQMNHNYNPKITLHAASVERAPELSVGDRLYYDAIAMEEKRAANREKHLREQEEEARRRKQALFRMSQQGGGGGSGQQYDEVTGSTPSSRSSSQHRHSNSNSNSTSSSRPPPVPVRRTAAQVADDLMNRHLEAMAARSQAVEAALAEPSHRPVTNPTSDEIVSRLPESTMERLTRPKHSGRPHRLHSHDRASSMMNSSNNSHNHNHFQHHQRSSSRSSQHHGPTFGEATYDGEVQYENGNGDESVPPPGGALVVSEIHNNSSNNNKMNTRLSRQQIRERELQRQMILQRRQEKREERMRALRMEKAAKELEDCTFHPQINHHRSNSNNPSNNNGNNSQLMILSPRSAAAAANNNNTGGYPISPHRQHDPSSQPADFLERTAAWVQRKEKHTQMERIRRKEQELQGCTFQPEIHPPPSHRRSSSPENNHHNNNHHHHNASYFSNSVMHSMQDGAAATHHHHNSMTDGGDANNADGVDDFVARMAYARRVQEEAAARAEATGSRWEKGKLTVPKPFRLSADGGNGLGGHHHQQHNNSNSLHHHDDESHEQQHNIKALERPFPMPDPVLSHGLNEFLAGMDDDSRMIHNSNSNGNNNYNPNTTSNGNAQQHSNSSNNNHGDGDGHGDGGVNFGTAIGGTARGASSSSQQREPILPPGVMSMQQQQQQHHHGDGGGGGVAYGNQFVNGNEYAL